MDEIEQVTATPGAQRTPAELSNFLESRVGTVLKGAANVGQRLLLMVFHTQAYQDREPELIVMLEGAANPLLTRVCRFTTRGDEPWEGQVLLVHLPDGEQKRPRLGVHVKSWRRSLTLDSEHIASRTMGIGTLLCDELADLEKSERLELLEMLSSSSEWHSQAGGGQTLSKTLFKIRNALREPYPIAVQRRDELQGLAVDAILAVDDRSFWIKGWRMDGERRGDRLLAVSPEGISFDLLPGAHLHDRKDVRSAYRLRYPDPERHAGFLHYFNLPTPSRLDDGWVCELHDRLGDAIEVSMPAVARDPMEVRNRILSELVLGTPDADFLARNHVHPALSRIREIELTGAGVATTLTFGDVPENPEATVVTALYQRFDLLEHQFARFIHDPSLRDTELLFVLDSPHQAEELEKKARGLHRLYGVPFRIAILNRNLGLSAACNLAAGLARGRRLVFMHSDVLPREPGWLRRLSQVYEATPDIGALGPRLLFEDGTIQSAGLFFREADDGSGWEAAHLLRGLHGGFQVSQPTRSVAAVSSACLMVARDRFDAIGGFRTDFVQGGYEDADLCLRLAEAGYTNWYSGSVELYHLEGRSFPGNLKALTGGYNRWLHQRSWGSQLTEIADRFPVRGIAPVDNEASP